jgi:hypothetical protein
MAGTLAFIAGKPDILNAEAQRILYNTPLRGYAKFAEDNKAILQGNTSTLTPSHAGRDKESRVKNAGESDGGSG